MCYLTAQAVADRLAVCPRTLRRWVVMGLFPPPIRLGRRCLRWSASDVAMWIEKKKTPNETTAAESPKNSAAA